MNAEQFVYWLNGYLELSGAQELNVAQVKSVREHLALVLHKVTPPGPVASPPAPAWAGPGRKPGYRGGAGFGGVQCAICSNWTSNEGGVCYKCKSVTVVTLGSGVNLSESLENLVCSPFTPTTPTSGYCDACGKEQHMSELKTISNDSLAGVVICKTCRNQALEGAELKSAESGMPILDVPLVLSC